MQIFDTALIEERLRDPSVGLESVFSAADYATAKSLADFRPNTAYVILISERNTADTTQPRFKSAAQATLGVVIAARNYRGQHGAAALQDVTKVVGKVRTALVGWSPQGCSPCVWQQGDVMDYDRSNLLWIDVYTTTHVLGGSS